MRPLQPKSVWLAGALAVLTSTARVEAQRVAPYSGTLHFGTGLITTPVAWVAPRNGTVWINLTGKDLPSAPNTGEQSFASRMNTNIALDTHWAGRVSLGVSAYSQNPEYGFFGQALLVRDGQLGFLPGIAIGARNIGRYKHEDRAFIGHDVQLDSTGAYDPIDVDRYEEFDTSPTLYVVATKEFAFSEVPNGTTLSLSVGGGNGLFSEDGGLGDQYNNSGTIARGLFLGGRLVFHPTLNTTLSLLAENDGWDWNAGIVADYRGITLGVYGTELEAGQRTGYDEGFNVYNYTKLAVALGFSLNIPDVSRGVILRTRISELTREQQRLQAEIASRERRIEKLEVALREAQAGELAQIERRRQQLEAQVEQERAAIRRATERLRELEQGRGARPTRPPPTTPPSPTGQ